MRMCMVKHSYLKKSSEEASLLCGCVVADALRKLTVCQKHTDGCAYHRSHLFLCQLLYQSQAIEVSTAQYILLLKSNGFTNTI